MPDIFGRRAVDYSGLFVVEYYGKKGWEIVSTGVSWLEAMKDFEDYGLEYQVRVTSPEKKKNELVEELEKIHEEHSKDITTPQEFADRVVMAVVAEVF